MQTRGTYRGRKENVVVVKKVRTRGRTTTTTEVPETTRRSIPVRNRQAYNNRNVNRERAQSNNENTDEIKVRIYFQAFT
jgi:hypothetical protein